MYRKRVQKLRESIRADKLDAAFISSVSNIEYLTGFTNFSKDEREAYLLVGGGFGYIITDGRYSEVIKRDVSHLTLFERGNEKQIDKLFKKHKKEIKTLGIEEDNLTVAEFKIVKKHFKHIKHFSAGHLRSIKTDEEIKKIKKACQTSDLAFDYIVKQIKVGITEKEIAQELEKFIKSYGAAISFPPIVAFGKNSSVPHHQTGDQQLTINEKLILLDFGVKMDGYCSDMTRTIFFGKPSERQKKIYDVVLEAQQKAVEFIKAAIESGQEIKAKEVDKIARKYITSHGYPTIPHSLGHGIGLEVHEHPSLSPKSKDILKAGMVFSIEPGIYLPGFGGVRIEDLFVIEKNGLKQMTYSPKERIVL
ncbi:aminopeptidase P family protein [Candidatus Daviesbacteria bacterium]|nr:aminopeptidase P family protein [Candidatus Daviesbacteria bacterium]